MKTFKKVIGLVIVVLVAIFLFLYAYTDGNISKDRILHRTMTAEQIYDKFPAREEIKHANDENKLSDYIYIGYILEINKNNLILDVKGVKETLVFDPNFIPPVFISSKFKNKPGGVKYYSLSTVKTGQFVSVTIGPSWGDMGITINKENKGSGQRYIKDITIYDNVVKRK